MVDSSPKPGLRAAGGLNLMGRDLPDVAVSVAKLWTAELFTIAQNFGMCGILRISRNALGPQAFAAHYKPARVGRIAQARTHIVTLRRHVINRVLRCVIAERWDAR